MQNSAAAMENSMTVPQKIKKIELPYDPVIPLLGIYPKELQEGLEEIFAQPYSLQHYSQ